MNLDSHFIKTLGVVGTICVGLGATGHLASAMPQDAGTSQVDRFNEARGQAKLSEARELVRQGRDDLARSAFQQALQFLPDNAEANSYLGTAVASPGMLQDGGADRIAGERDVLRQRARAEFDNFLSRAREHLGRGEFDDARRQALLAQVNLDQNRSLFGDSVYDGMIQQSETLRQQIDDADDAAKLAGEAAGIAESSQRLAEDRGAEASERARFIEENLHRIRALQAEQKYGEALEVVDEILFLDPHNPSALILRDVLRPMSMYIEYANIRGEKEWQLAGLTHANQRSVIPPGRNITGPGMKSLSGLMSYPEDWPQLSLMRTGAVGWNENPADYRVAQVLANRRTPVNFNRHSLGQVVAFFRDLSEEDVYVDWKALELIGVNETDPVSLNLSNVSIRVALDRVMEQLGDDIERPKWDVQDGMVRISSENALRQDTTTRLYDIRDLLFEVPYFDNAPKMDLNSVLEKTNAINAGTNAFSGGGSLFETPDSDPRRSNGRQDLVEHIIDLIQNNVDPDGWRDLGGDTGSVQELNGNLVITQTPRQHRQIDGLLNQLREIRAIQINVEGRILQVDTNWFEQIGVDLDLYFNTNNGLFNQLRAADPLAQLSDFFDPGNRNRLKDPIIYGGVNDVDGDGVLQPLPSGAVPNSVAFGNAFGVPDATNTNINYTVGPVGAPIRATDGFTPIGVQNDSFELIGDLAGFDLASFAGLAAANGPALATGIQFLDDVQVDLLIEATQADKRSVVLTAPRLTLFNGQRSFVVVQTQTTFVSGLTAVTGDNSGAFQPILNPLNEGVTLDVEGVVSADRRYVTMTVSIGLSEILAIEQKGPFGGSAGGGDLGGDANGFTGFVESPTIQVSQVQTTVSVPDKGTVLLGGQRIVNEIEVEVGVPVLSKIPIVNRFFTNRVTAKDESSLLFLVRPEIIIQQENEDTLFPGLLDQLGTPGSYIQ